LILFLLVSLAAVRRPQVLPHHLSQRRDHLLRLSFNHKRVGWLVCFTMVRQHDAGHRRRYGHLLQEKRIILICFFIALGQFQYGYDSAAIAGFQAMPGFLSIFGYFDVGPGFSLCSATPDLKTSVLRQTTDADPSAMATTSALRFNG